MKRILIVDDDKLALNFFKKQLQPYESDFKIVTAGNGREAVAVLKRVDIDLVITDLQMPKMDGFELLAYMSGEYPGIPAFAMTSLSSPSIREKIEKIQLAGFFEKPINMDKFIKAIYAEFEKGAEGKIRGIGLVSFLQLINMDKKTCTLTIRSGSRQGKIYLLNGEINAAETGALKKLEAACEMLTWEKTDIKIENTNIKKDNEINQPIMNILMEGLRLKDEKDAQKK